VIRFRRTIDSGVIKTHAWRFGPVSGLRCDFSFGGYVHSLHLGRLSISRGGEDPISEGFVDGTKAWWLKASYPQIVVAWWPKNADKRGRSR